MQSRVRSKILTKDQHCIKPIYFDKKDIFNTITVFHEKDYKRLENGPTKTTLAISFVTNLTETITSLCCLASEYDNPLVKKKTFYYHQLLVKLKKIYENTCIYMYHLPQPYFHTIISTKKMYFLLDTFYKVVVLTSLSSTDKLSKKIYNIAYKLYYIKEDIVLT
jgi:hypothetical protein